MLAHTHRLIADVQSRLLGKQTSSDEPWFILLPSSPYISCCSVRHGMVTTGHFPVDRSNKTVQIEFIASRAADQSGERVNGGMDDLLCRFSSLNPDCKQIRILCLTDRLLVRGTLTNPATRYANG